MNSSVQKKKILKYSFLLLVTSSPLLLIASCQTNTTIKNNSTSDDPSWFSYYDTTNNVNIKIDLPYCTWNVEQLCKTTTTVSAGYEICTNKNDFKNLTHIDHALVNGIHFGTDWDNFYYAPHQFMGYLFSGLTHQIIGVNFPKNLEGVYNNFADSMFEGNTSNSVLPLEFTLPQNLYYCGTWAFDQMFYNSNVILPPDSDFNLPQKLIYARNRFCHEMFRNYEFTYIPKNFQIPQNVKYLDSAYFCENLFRNCSVLEPGDSSTLPLIIPKNYSGSSSCFSNMFVGATLLNDAGVPATPSEYDQIYIKRG